MFFFFNCLWTHVYRFKIWLHFLGGVRLSADSKLLLAIWTMFLLQLYRKQISHYIYRWKVVEDVRFGGLKKSFVLFLHGLFLGFIKLWDHWSQGVWKVTVTDSEFGCFFVRSQRMRLRLLFWKPSLARSSGRRPQVTGHAGVTLVFSPGCCPATRVSRTKCV